MMVAMMAKEEFTSVGNYHDSNNNISRSSGLSPFLCCSRRCRRVRKLGRERHEWIAMLLPGRVDLTGLDSPVSSPLPGTQT